MGEVVRGQITDRPWGLTFGQFGIRQVTGQLTVAGSDHRGVRVAFVRGLIVGATSSLAADAATRIAMTMGFLSSSHAPTVARQIAATPEIDEIALLASAARLTPAQVQQLRRRVLVQRAARTFSIEAGTFVLDDDITIPYVTDAEVDIRAAVYHGARMNLSEQRLTAELRELGSYFTLDKTALEHAEQFGLDVLEWPLLDALRERTTLPELEARHRDLDPRNVQSVLYALVSCRDCSVEREDFAEPRTVSKTNVAVSFKPTRSGEHALPRSASGTQAPSFGDPSSANRPARDPSENEFRATGSAPERPGLRPPLTTMPLSPAPTTPAAGPSLPPAQYADDRPVARSSRTPTNSTPLEPRVRTPANYADDVGVPRGTGVPNPPVPEPRVMTPPLVARTASSPAAPTVPRTTSGRGRPVSPAPAVAGTQSGSPSASGSFSMPRTISQSATKEFEQAESSDRITQSFSQAADAFRLGEEALRQNQIEIALVHLSNASTLNPHEFIHSALFAYAQFLNAPAAERAKSADKVRKMLNHATQKAREPEQARFYLGQVEQLLGRNKEAIEHYQAILRAVPNHAQALAAIQSIEGKALEKSGLGLFRKK